MRPAVHQGELEIIIGGNEEEMHPPRWNLANEVANDLSRIMSLGSAYLDSFVDRQRFAPGGEWFLDALEFGREETQKHNEFTAGFGLHNDIYGRWSVGFRHDARLGLYPFSFSRQQW